MGCGHSQHWQAPEPPRHSSRLAASSSRELQESHSPAANRKRREMSHRARLADTILCAGSTAKPQHGQHLPKGRCPRTAAALVSQFQLSAGCLQDAPEMLSAHRCGCSQDAHGTQSWDAHRMLTVHSCRMLVGLSHHAHNTQPLQGWSPCSHQHTHRLQALVPHAP